MKAEATDNPKPKANNDNNKQQASRQAEAEK